MFQREIFKPTEAKMTTRNTPPAGDHDDQSPRWTAQVFYWSGDGLRRELRLVPDLGPLGDLADKAREIDRIVIRPQLPLDLLSDEPPGGPLQHL
jgi:hypothetical protein